jgi:hypothetical protein
MGQHTLQMTQLGYVLMYFFAHATRRRTDQEHAFKRPAEHTDMEIDGREVPGLEVPVRLNLLSLSIRNYLNQLSLPSAWAMAGPVGQGIAIQLAQGCARSIGQSLPQTSIEPTRCWSRCSATRFTHGLEGPRRHQLQLLRTLKRPRPRSQVRKGGVSLGSALVRVLGKNTVNLNVG